MFDSPYENPEVVSKYEDRYTFDKRVTSEIDFEIASVENEIKNRGLNSWCDVACGTGHHLRTVKSDVLKYGIDKSLLMVSHYNDETVDVKYLIEDFLFTDTRRKFDLVTNFWFGYSHQPTLEDVTLFLNNMANITSDTGTVILSIHNQWGLFDKIPQKTKEPMGGTFSFDAIVWSYDEPGVQNSTYKCIVPHTDYIVEVFSKKFNSVIIRKYPHNQYAGGKELLVATEKKV